MEKSKRCVTCPDLGDPIDLDECSPLIQAPHASWTFAPRLIGGILMAAGLVGCSGGWTGGGETTPSPEFTPSSSGSPMPNETPTPSAYGDCGYYVCDHDDDGDGYTYGDGDCDDSDPYTWPDATEIGDGADNDCDGEIDESVDPTVDFDGDGYLWTSPDQCTQNACDCDDSDPLIHSTAPEIVNDGIDQDCDGTDRIDADLDGYVAPISGGDDCDDSDPSIHPTAQEIGDGRDNDCDDQIDDDVDPSLDFDGDGHTWTSPEECPDTDCDCDDSDPRIHSSAADIAYDGIDQNCDGADRIDIDSDDHASTSVGGDDCNDFEQYTFPGAPEIRDGVDNDCDGQIDDHIDPILDQDDDGYPGGSAADCSTGTCDCNDSRPDIHPAARELCDGIDNDCDGKKDSSSCASAITFHLDTTYGGYGDNPLAVVPKGAYVYLVGNFTAWNPNHAGFEMSDPEGDGVWTLTLPVPFMGYAHDETMSGTPTQYNAGDSIEFKFAITSSSPCNPTAPDYDSACWSEGQKLFMTQKEALNLGKYCRGDDTNGGVWQLDPLNYSLVVPTDPIGLHFRSEAWEATGASNGYPLCD